MKLHLLWVLASASLLGACATHYLEEKTSTQKKDAIGSYTRSKPVAPPPPPFQDFAFIDGDTISVALNPGLVSAQARQHCDQKPVERLMVTPGRPRQCLQIHDTSRACIQWETGPGEQQPPCEKTWIFNSSVCVAREDPNQPKLSYRYTQDCYATPAPADAIGKVGVMAVPPGTTALAAPQAGRLVSAPALIPKDGKPHPIRLTGEVQPGECLMLTDPDGLPIPVREPFAARDIHTFSTPRLAAQTTLAALEKKSAEAQALVTKLRREREAQGKVVVASKAWTGDRCAVPAPQALPLKPTLPLSSEEIFTHARGLCAMTLSTRVKGLETVFKATAANELFEYQEAVTKLGFRASAVHACVRGGHNYELDDLAYVNRESTRLGAQSGSWLGFFDGIFKDASTTESQIQNRIGGMLQSCTHASARKCAAPVLEWEEQVTKIRQEPQRLLAACERDHQSWQRTSTTLKAAEQDAITAELAPIQARTTTIATGRMPLSGALCKAQ
jgi:hypothetical protein